MSVATALQIVSAVNTLVGMAAEMGLSLQMLARYQQQAALEGREFGLADLQKMGDETNAALERLHAAIEAARQQ